jgi:hypothetical protein
MTVMGFHRISDVRHPTLEETKINRESVGHFSQYAQLSPWLPHKMGLLLRILPGRKAMHPFLLTNVALGD